MRKKRHAAAAPPSVETLPSEWSWDRLLVGLFMGLIVARLQLPGTDPGRLSLGTGIADIVWNSLLLLLGLAAAIRRAASGNLQRLMNGPALLLLALAVLSLVMTWTRADYKRPGLFITSEWSVAAMVFVLARSVPVDPATRSRIVAVLLACLADICVQAVYQMNSATNPPLAINPAFSGIDEFETWRNQPPGSESSTIAVLLGLLPMILIRRRGRSSGDLAGFAFILLTAYFILRWDIPACLANGWMTGGFLGCGPLNDTRSLAEPLSIGLLPEMTASIGWLSLPLLLAFFVLSIHRRFADDSLKSPSTIDSQSFPWEMYLAGIFGMSLGLLLRLADRPVEMADDELLKRLGFELLRSLLWFGLIAWFDRYRQSSHNCRMIFALSSIGLFAGMVLWQIGLSSRSLVLLLLLRGLCRPIAADTKKVSPLMAWLLVPLCLAWFALYLAECALPAVVTNSAVREARRASFLLPGMANDIQIATELPQADAVRRADVFLVNNILQPLMRAERYDPNNSSLHLETARWLRMHWKNTLMIRDTEETARVTRRILERTEVAIRLDPINPAGYRAQLEAILLFMTESSTRRAERLKVALRNIAKIVERYPQEEVALRYRLVKLLADSKDPLAEAEAVELLRLNRVEGQPHGRLDDQQGRDLAKQVNDYLKTPNPDLLEEWVR